MFQEDYWLLCALVVGACVGSFLNVVIYRVPLGLSVNKPARSFCPGCEAPIPWWRNLPVLTWILQRGKCAGCQGKISARYVLVEALTAVIFMGLWMLFPGEWRVLLGWIFLSLLISISFIDGEHFLIPVHWCYVGMGVALIGSLLTGGLLHLGSPMGGDSASWISLTEPWGGRVRDLWRSFLGLGCGYFSLVAVVLFGKMAFGKQQIEIHGESPWFLREPQTDDEQLQLVIREEAYDWGELFYRKSDRVELEGGAFLLDGQPVAGSTLVIWAEEVEISGKRYPISEMDSLEGRAEKVVIPREAMGGGDPPLLGMIGAFLGAPAVLFTIFSSCIFALIASAIGRVGFGKPLPYGPFLALGGVCWLFGGHQLFSWYLNLMGM